MNDYRLTHQAALDLEEIFEFVRADSPRAALQLLADIDGALLQLAEMPRAGHVRVSLATSDVRFWVVHTYLVVYRAEVTPIEVLRIVSGYRDLGEVLAWGVSEADEAANSLAVGPLQGCFTACA